MAVISYKCPNCGGELVFDPKTQKYKCAYCVSSFTQEELDAANPQAAEAAQSNTAGTTQNSTAERVAGHTTESTSAEKTTNENPEKDGDAVVYTCPSCGAEIVTDATTAATFCFYCHNPVVLQGRLEGKYLPSKVIPFQIDKDQAVKEFLDYVGTKKFVPRGFFSKQQIEKLSGIYFPYWVCKYETRGEVTATGTKVRVYRMGDSEITETSFYRVERRGDMEFSNLTANALKKADHNLIEGVQPYLFDKAVDFNMGYLSGFQAEKRDMEQADLEEEMTGEMQHCAKEALRNTISGYGTVTGENYQITAKKETWEYCLLPAWVLTYHGKDGKRYYYAMNGQTKNVYGELPLDYTKLGILAAIIFAVVFLIALMGGYFL